MASRLELKPIRAWSLLGNGQRLDGGAMFGNAPRPMWEKWIPPDELGRIPLACRALLVEVGTELFLCETGVGAFFEPELAERYGVQEPTRHWLRENLNRLGFSEEDIDYVILSHLHFDHAGGLLPTFSEMQAGRTDLLFPKARYVVGREAWERALKPHFRDRASFIPGMTVKLLNSGRLTIIEGDHLPGPYADQVRFIYSQGHTPGQMLTHFIGPKGDIVFCGDLVPGTQWVHLPITMGYDRYPELLIEEKERLYQEALAGGWYLFFTHDVSVSCARLALTDKGRYQPIEPQAEMRAVAL